MMYFRIVETTIEMNETGMSQNVYRKRCDIY